MSYFICNVFTINIIHDKYYMMMLYETCYCMNLTNVDKSDMNHCSYSRISVKGYANNCLLQKLFKTNDISLRTSNS